MFVYLNTRASSVLYGHIMLLVYKFGLIRVLVLTLVVYDLCLNVFACVSGQYSALSSIGSSGQSQVSLVPRRCVCFVNSLPLLAAPPQAAYGR